MSSRKSSRERTETDRSLELERERTDAEIQRRDRNVAEAADSAVDHARNTADDAVMRERARTDRSAKANDVAAEVAEERASDDATALHERAVIDARLAEERATRRRAIDILLGGERLSTDQHLGTERDVSDQALESRDAFLAMVAHDLRTMVTVVGLHAAALARHATAEDVTKQALGAARNLTRLATRMGRLVGDLLDIASLEAGRMKFAFTRDDVRKVVTEALDLFVPLASAQGVRVEQDLADTLPASFDAGRILQVLANLLSNALKFTPRGGTITVRVGAVGSDVRVSVSDTGPGIPKDHLEAVFARFSQIDPGDRRGLGIGLFISRAIIGAHGGRIWAESVPGEGSTFSFTLPAVASD